MSRKQDPFRAKGLTNQQRYAFALCGKHHDTPEYLIALAYQMAWDSDNESRRDSALQAMLSIAHPALMAKDADFFRRLADALEVVTLHHIPGGGMRPANQLAVDILELWNEGKRTTAEFKKSLRTKGYDVDHEHAWKAIQKNVKQLCPRVKISVGGRPRKGPLKRK